MVSLQTVGAHLHVDSSDHHGTTHHGAHFEHSLSSDHFADGHDEHVDVSLQDYAPKFSNVDNFVFVASPGYEILTLIGETRWFVPISKAPPRKSQRHRPPLRAPPAQS